MKLHIVLMTILCLALAGMPAWAQWSYDNGPINGNTSAWTINSGYIVSDTFYAGGTTSSFAFDVWQYVGDTLKSVDWSITTGENGGTTIGSGTASTSGGPGGTLTEQYVSFNQQEYDIDLVTVTGLNVATASGSIYWLNLQNAVVPSGDPVYWDENSGTGCGGSGGGANCPSFASENQLGTIPSEAFTVTGSNGGGTTPEPSSIMLFGSGVLGLAGVLRRKLLQLGIDRTR
jgi:PEP-CTERM motif